MLRVLLQHSWPNYVPIALSCTFKSCNDAFLFVCRLLPLAFSSVKPVISKATMMQGVLRIRASDCGIDPVSTLVKLWVHEHSLVYTSRCSRPEDAFFIKELLHRISQRKLGSQDTLEGAFGSKHEPLVFSEFVTLATSGVKTASRSRKGLRPYELVTGVHFHAYLFLRIAASCSKYNLVRCIHAKCARVLLHRLDCFCCTSMPAFFSIADLSHDVLLLKHTTMYVCFRMGCITDSTHELQISVSWRELFMRLRSPSLQASLPSFLQYTTSLVPQHACETPVATVSFSAPAELVAKQRHWSQRLPCLYELSSLRLQHMV